jgi:hypothetical protein
VATWSDVRQFVSSQYKVSQDLGQGLKLEFAVRGNRSQLVFLTLVSNDAGEEWVRIESPFAKVGEFTDYERLLHSMSGHVCGGLAIFGDEMLAFRHAAPLANLDPNELVRPMEILLNMADAYELDITGQDRF